MDRKTLIIHTHCVVLIYLLMDMTTGANMPGKPAVILPKQLKCFSMLSVLTQKRTTNDGFSYDSP